METPLSGLALINCWIFPLVVSFFVAQTLRNLSAGLPPQGREQGQAEPLHAFPLPKFACGFSDHTALAIGWSLCRETRRGVCTAP